ncbi:MAG TPA: NUDIX domain-containing protein [Acidobacteriota bacterium]|nr:NUDIX domain-containing protein [Acidobacteriota bacterium]
MSEKIWYPTFADYLKAEYQGPYSATDILIRYPVDGLEGLVLIQRKHKPLGLASPGGMAEHMELYQNAIKEGKEETGLTVYIDEPHWRPFGIFSKPSNDPRAFISSNVFTGAGYGVIKPHPEEDAIDARAYRISEVRDLLTQPDKWAFQSHRRFIELYVNERYANGDRKWNEPARPILPHSL